MNVEYWTGFSTYARTFLDLGGADQVLPLQQRQNGLHVFGPLRIGSKSSVCVSLGELASVVLLNPSNEALRLCEVAVSFERGVDLSRMIPEVLD